MTGWTRGEKWWMALSLLPLCAATATMFVVLLRGHSPAPYMWLYGVAFVIFCVGQAVRTIRRSVRNGRGR